MNTLKRIIGGALLTVGVIAAGLGPASGTAHADPAYWHYCPGQKWQYTTPLPPGTDLSVCHWFLATAIPHSGIPVRFNLVEIDPSQVPPSALQPSPGSPPR